MYNTNLQDMGYQTLNQNYDSPISVYKNLDSLVGNYSHNESKSIRSEFNRIYS